MSLTLPNAATDSPAVRSGLLRLARTMRVPSLYAGVVPTTRSVRRPEKYERLEESVARRLGGWPVKLPYSDLLARSASETDVDHVVPLGYAMRRGAWAWPQARWDEFQTDPANLTLASPAVNRREKGAKGIGRWVPAHHRVWYAADFVLVCFAYELRFVDADVAELAAVLPLEARDAQ